MPAQKRTDHGRWTATVPDEDVRPVGHIDCARKALAHLGPFKHSTHEEADASGRREGLGGRVGLSTQLAWERIWILATTFNRQQSLDRRAPRSGDVIEGLTKLETLAGELARHLKSLDDITLHRLQTGGTGITEFLEIADDPLMREADASALPLPSGWKGHEEESKWVQRLNALSQYSNAALKMFLTSRRIESLDAPDKGGNTNLYKSIYGSASWALVSEGWHVFELFKPGKATGTEGGPFHLFLLDVFEYATGLDPEVHAKLTSWVKRMSSVNRRYQSLVARREALSEEQQEISLSRIEPGFEERERRISEIGMALLAVERERLELWPSLFPFSYPGHKGRAENLPGG
jgi:hypothetical protein